MVTRGPPIAAESDPACGDAKMFTRAHVGHMPAPAPKPGLAACEVGVGRVAGRHLMAAGEPADGETLGQFGGDRFGDAAGC